MRSFFFGFMVFILYAVFARYYYVCEIKNNCFNNKTAQEENEIAPASLSLFYKDSLLLSNYDPFRFEYGSIQPETGENTMDFIMAVVAEMKEDENKSLKITGFMRKEEIGTRTNFGENIAIARAMKIQELVVDNGISEQDVILFGKTYEDSSAFEPVKFELLDTKTVNNEE